MTPARSARHPRVLAVHPTTRGFGWIVFESPMLPVTWGTASASAKRNARLIRRFARILRRNDPDVLVMEDFASGVTKRGERTQQLCDEIAAAAQSSGLAVAVYPRFVIQAALGVHKAATRREVAEIIAERIEALRPRLPKERKPWMPEMHTQSLFDAAAVATAHFSANSRSA